VHQSLHSNGCGADNSEPIIASLPSNDKQTLVLLLLCAFRGFYGFNSYCMGEVPQYFDLELNTMNRIYHGVRKIGTLPQQQLLILKLYGANTVHFQKYNKNMNAINVIL
jgi:hypothetical protein